MNIYVGNLSYSTTEETLKKIFEEFGEVTSVKVIIDQPTGKSRGYAFVVMDNGAEAIKELDGRLFEGRNLKVNEARPVERDSRGGSQGPRGGFGGPRGGGQRSGGSSNGPREYRPRNNDYNR